jgi:DNA-binding CsgD family transcriptional regulator
MMQHEDDVAAITALIHRNRIAMWMRDYEVWASCFIHEPYLTRWGWWPRGGVFAQRGWDDISARLKHEWSQYPDPHPELAYDTQVRDLQIRVGGNFAWATFQLHFPPSEVRGHAGPELVNEALFLERRDGEWRIAFLGMLDGGTPYDSMRRRIRLDAQGRVQSSPSEMAWMADDDDLVIRAGRLRIRDDRADSRLQAAIRWAANLDQSYMSTAGAMPIVMEAGEGLPAKLWWVLADSGRIVFSVGDPRFTESRLDMATTVYGLSPAQRRVAGLVADGLNLNEIARRMEITPNTARTHLQRVFEKTGVRNQAALVRVLLSAAPV